MEDRETAAGDVTRMVGGAYRLAAIAVDIDTNLLGRRSRRVGDMLRSHRLLWRRWNRVRARHLEADPASPH